MKKNKIIARSRSKWKFVYTKIYPLRLKIGGRFRKYTYVFDRNSTSLSRHIGRIFYVHKGNGFHKRVLTKEMTGFKFGEFIGTTKMGSSIHKTLKNKNKKR